MASRRGYVTTTEVDAMTELDASTDTQISEAEELIDAYVGFQEKFYKQTLSGKCAAGGTTQFTIESDEQNVFEKDFFVGMEVEFFGTGGGQRTIITGSTKAGVLTLQTTLSTAVDSTTRYRIYQLGKFPRKKDVFYDGENTPYQYFKQIPEAVKRATAAQVEFMIKMGDTYFQTDKALMEGETIGDYSYTKGDQGSGGSLANLIAPKAKVLLRGIVNRTGTVVA